MSVPLHDEFMSYFIQLHFIFFKQSSILVRSPQLFFLLPLILQLFIIVRITTAVGHRSSVRHSSFVCHRSYHQNSYLSAFIHQSSFISEIIHITTAIPSRSFSSVTVQTIRVIARHFQSSIYAILLYYLDFGAKLLSRNSSVNIALFSKLIKEVLRLVNCFYGYVTLKCVHPYNYLQ